MIDDRHFEAGEDVTQMCLRFSGSAIRCEPVIDGDAGLVGHHIPRDSTSDEHRLQALAILQAVDTRSPRCVGREPCKDVGKPMDRVLAHPCARGVCTSALYANLDAHRALTAGLDDRLRRFHEDCEVAAQEFGPRIRDPFEAVELCFDLLRFIEEVRDIASRRGEFGGEFQLHRDAALHVAGPQAVQPVFGDIAAARGVRYWCRFACMHEQRAVVAG